MTPAPDGLVVEALHAGHGTGLVLHGVDLRVAPGEVVALLGRNGAGRSTLVHALMGLLPAARGRVQWRGRDVSGLSAHARARTGFGLVPERRDVFPRLTVRENLLLGRKPRPAADMPGLPWDDEETWRTFPALAARRDVEAGVLSGGEQQMLALARTLTGRPQLLLVDEPTEGLAPAVVAQVAALLRRLREAGVAVLLVEQRLSIALEVADRVAVMGHGRIVHEGTPAALQDDEAVLSAWLSV